MTIINEDGMQVSSSPFSKGGFYSALLDPTSSHLIYFPHHKIYSHFIVNLQIACMQI
jgi:hypothetical protein